MLWAAGGNINFRVAGAHNPGSSRQTLISAACTRLGSAQLLWVGSLAPLAPADGLSVVGSRIELREHPELLLKLLPLWAKPLAERSTQSTHRQGPVVAAAIGSRFSLPPNQRANIFSFGPSCWDGYLVGVVAVAVDWRLTCSSWPPFFTSCLRTTTIYLACR